MSKTKPHPLPPRPFSLRTLVLLVVSALVGIGTGGLTYLGTPHAAACILAGAAAAGASLVALDKLVE